MVVSQYQENRYVLKRYVENKVSRLQKLNEQSSSLAKGELARLRRGAGTAPGAFPEIWEIEYESIPKELVGKGSEPSTAEWAIHIVMTLYATHQQSQSARMHVPGKEHGLGHAIRLLEIKEQRKKEGADQKNQGMPRRFASLINAGEPEAIAHYGRQIVKQLRAQEIPLDYGALAADIYGVLDPYHCDEVRLAWCRQFVQPVTQDVEEEKDQSETSE